MESWRCPINFNYGRDRKNQLDGLRNRGKISYMDRKKITAKLQAHAQSAWETFIEIYPRLARFDCPKIVLNGRYTRSAGMCFYTLNKIDISLKYYLFHENHILTNTLVHELAHQVDYNLNGEDNKLQGHGVKWQKIMTDYGIPADRFHTMAIPNMKLSEMVELLK